MHTLLISIICICPHPYPLSRVNARYLPMMLAFAGALSWWPSGCSAHLSPEDCHTSGSVDGRNPAVDRWYLQYLQLEGFNHPG